MKYFFFVLGLTLVSCAELQKSTSVNMLGETPSVKILASEKEASACKPVTTVRGEDNLMSLGKSTAIENMKRFAAGKEANALWVSECKETKTAISTITTCSGKAYQCK